MLYEPHFEISIETHFSAAHHLRGYLGDCAKPHGHNWIVEVYVMCDKLNDIGIGIDFRDMKSAVQTVIGKLDHINLNELAPFINENPSSEVIARHLYQELKSILSAPGIHLSRVKVAETPTCSVCYSGNFTKPRQ
ncbi:MAG: 6-carboxytetrahydropterin synthase QueD [Syntrophales bacterium]|jgi:6-pyruvoyltetrahydropterin/6-carboxytetrahydropterin synthase